MRRQPQTTTTRVSMSATGGQHTPVAACFRSAHTVLSLGVVLPATNKHLWLSTSDVTAAREHRYVCLQHRANCCLSHLLRCLKTCWVRPGARLYTAAGASCCLCCSICLLCYMGGTGEQVTLCTAGDFAVCLDCQAAVVQQSRMKSRPSRNNCMAESVASSAGVLNAGQSILDFTLTERDRPDLISVVLSFRAQMPTH